tara:strand:+ start:13473 stop:15077 length:1605 start_codon:yes stop_codon:yes gene_type:complete
MAKVWKKLQRADADFTGNVTGTFGSKAIGDFYRTDNKPSKADVGLSNVTNESKATMFANPTFTGTATGLSKESVGLGNVDNSKFNNGRFIGILAKSDGTAVFDPSTGDYTGKIDGSTASDVKSKAEAAKDAVDGNSSITMVGGSLSIGTPASGVYPFAVDSSGNLKIADDEFQALANGTVNCKGNFTINQDPNGDSKIVLKGDGTGQAEVEVQGANPTFDLGGTNPLGTSTLFIRRGGTGNQSRILFQTGTTNKFGIGVSHTVDNDQFWIHNGNGYSGSSPHPERVLSFNPDGKTGFFANTKTVNGFTFGSDGTNKHVYIKDGGLGIGTTSITDNDLNVQGTSIFNGNVTLNSDIDVSGSCTFQGEAQFDDATNGLSYSDLSNKPTIPSANTLSYSTSVIDGAGYIWVMPSQFMPNDDNSYYNAAIVDNGAQARVMTSSLELYANIPIPTGYKVTHFRLNGTSSVQVSIYYSDVTTSTATSAQVTTLYTNSDNATNPSSGIQADATNGRYIILKWNPTSTSHRLYGARLKIAKI